MKYHHVFFDLDRTLWDLETNSLNTLKAMYEKYKLKEKGLNEFETFIKEYKKINHQLWDQYRKGQVSKTFLRDERFSRTLEIFGIKDKELAANLGRDYIHYSPRQTRLFPNTIEILDYLKNNYRLHIITNGFEEVQDTKMKHSGLRNYFDQIITSERAGSKKPNKEIFKYAIEATNANIEESIMIGDDPEVDIKGAADYGMDQVFFNPLNHAINFTPTYTIQDLIELKKIL